MKINFSAMLAAGFGAFIGAGLIAFCLKFGWFGLEYSASSISHAESSTEAPIAEYNCRYGETRELLFLGEPDDYHFSHLDGSEAPKINTHLEHLPGILANNPAQRRFDEPGTDKAFSDYFEFPPDIARGTFFIRMKPGGRGSENDTLQIGSLAERDPGYNLIPRFSMYSKIESLESFGWTKDGDVYSVEFSEMDFKYQAHPQDIENEFAKFQDYLATQHSSHKVDLVISDDTQVDFAAAVICLKPAQKSGVSFAVKNSITPKVDGLVVLVCRDEPTAYPCNGIYGDTSCQAELPIACFRNSDAPTPDLPKENYVYETHWSGGEVRFTKAVAGQDFATLSDVDQFCEDQFGQGFRIVQYHQAGDSNLVGFSPDGELSGRAWVDIRDQAQGTCWARE